MIDGVLWRLVMKLSKNSFCYGSEKWDDDKSYNAGYLANADLPSAREYDAKAKAFTTMKTNELMLETSRGKSVRLRFVSLQTPQKLMTVNSPETRFAEYPDWYKWREHFGWIAAGRPSSSGEAKSCVT